MAEAVKTKPKSKVKKKHVKTSHVNEIEKAVDALHSDVQVHVPVATKKEVKLEENAKKVVLVSPEPLVDSTLSKAYASSFENVDTSEKQESLCLVDNIKPTSGDKLEQVKKNVISKYNSSENHIQQTSNQKLLFSKKNIQSGVDSKSPSLAGKCLLEQNHTVCDKSPLISADVKFVENELQRISLERLASSSFDTRMSEPKRTDICLNKSSIVERTKCTSKVYPILKSPKETVCLQSLIKIELNALKCRVDHCSQLALQEFFQIQKDIEKHELYELLIEYLSSRRELLKLQSDLRLSNEVCKQNKEKLWREISETLTAKAKCKDGAVVEISHSFVSRDFNAEIYSEIQKALNSTHDKLESLSYHSYISELCYLQVESYIYYLLSESPRLRQVSLSDSVKAYMQHQLPNSHPEEMGALKTCITILFAFQRRYICDDKFISDTRGWLNRLVAVLLRKATFFDHLFLLNHIIRCPAKIKWAIPYVQPPPLSSDNPSVISATLDHLLTVLQMILSQIPERENFLKSYKKIVKGNNHFETDEEWAVINFEDETIEELPSQYCHPDDIISLLGQIPFSAMFSEVLLESGASYYDDNKRLQKLIAFAKLVLDILANGLQTYQVESYVQVLKRICDMIRLTVLRVSDYLMNFIFNNKTKSREIKMCYQEEFDIFFCHGLKYLFVCNSATSWESMANLPYQYVSEDAVWNILCILHTSFNATKLNDGENNERSDNEIEESEAKFSDPIVRKLFEEKLCYMEDTMACYLLHTLSKMAQLRKESKFASAVTLEIFEICVLHHKLYHKFFEKGKTFISGITKIHPSVISVLLEEVKDINIEDKDMISFFEELPLYLWHPRSEDINILSEWLLNHSFTQKTNQCARFIFSNMNWGLNLEGNKLAHSIELHRKVALIVVQAYMKYKYADSKKSLLSQGIQQMFQLTAPLRLSNASSTKQDFITWVWNMLFTLRLHALDKPHLNLQDMLTTSRSVPDICHILQQGIEEKQPAAFYVALVMTKLGHNLDHISMDGFKLISDLVNEDQYAPAIHALFYITPYLYANTDVICSKSFMLAFQKLVTADLTYMSLTQQEPFLGQVITQLASMMKYQIIMTTKIAKELACSLIKMWIKLLIKTLLTEDKQSLLVMSKGQIQVYYLLDQVVRVAFLDTYFYSCVMEHLQSLIMPIVTSPLASQKKQSFFTAFWRNYKNISSLIPHQSLPYFPWFALCVFSSEYDTPQFIKLWNDILKKLAVDPNLTVEAAVQSTTTSMKVPSLYLNNLPIYRWSQQIVDTAINHPAMPLLWQRFFLAFLQRIPSEVGFPERHGVGKRFFCTSSTSKIFIALKSKVKEIKAYYLQEKSRLSDELTKVLDLKSKLSNYDYENDQSTYRIPELKSCIELFGKLINLYHTFNLWLEDTALHSATLCIPELGPEYQQELLISVLKNDKRVWIQYVNIERMKAKLELHKWGTCYNRSLNENESASMLHNELKNNEYGTYETLHLDTDDEILPPPPIHLLQCPVQEVSEKTFKDSDSLLKFLEFNQKIFIEQSSKYKTQMSKLKKLDEYYLCLINEKYADKDKEVSLKGVCRKGPEGTKNGCAGSASFHLLYKQKEIVERVVLQIENNREQQFLLMNKLQNPSLKDLCSAATYTEKCFRMLVKKTILLEGKAECEQMKNIGIALFYKMAKVADETCGSSRSSIQYHPASRFFSSCLELLGMKFIYNEESQLIPLAESVLKHPSIGSHLTPYFQPGCASVNIFLKMYDALVKAVDSAPPEPVFSLLTKIDLHQWLEEMKLKIAVSQRNLLIENIGRGLLKCGSKLSELEKLHGPFKKHLKILTLYQFPEHYGTVLNFLLNGTDLASLSVCVWYDFFISLGCKVSETETSIEAIRRALAKFASKQRFCSDFELKETLDNLGKHFTEKRVVCPKVLQYSLYYKYQTYITALSIFYGMMGHALVEIYSEDHSMYAAEVIWKILYSSFKPWIDPSGEGDAACFPWLPNEDGKALQMFKMFVDCLNFHYILHKEENGNFIMSLALKYYINTYIVTNIRNYAINVCHTALQGLPWNDFFPSIEDMQAMCEGLDKNMPESQNFLGSICANIPWKKVLEQLLLKQHPEMERNLHYILQLLIKFSWEASIIKGGCFLSVLKSLESDYSDAVQCLAISTIQELFAVYFEKCNSACLLDKEVCSTSPDVALLKFLKIVCCMSPAHSPSAHPESHQKRLLYVNYYVQLLSKCASEQPALLLTKCSNFSSAFISLLEEVENIISIISLPKEQFIKATSLLSQVLSVLNIIHEQKLQDAVLHSLLDWLKKNSQSILFLPCMQVSFHCFASMYHLVSVVECCISSYFQIASSSAEECWKTVFLYFVAPEMTQREFITECIKENSHLTQYAYVKNRLTTCQSPSDKITVLENLVEWNSCALPSIISEPKLVVLWFAIIDISTELISTSEKQVVGQCLIKFCKDLIKFGRDSISGSRFSWLLGRTSSSLSVKFRFLCRALAAYLLAQLPDGGMPRMKSSAAGHITSCRRNSTENIKPAGPTEEKVVPSQQAIKAATDLESLLSNRSYCALVNIINTALEFLNSPEHCLIHSKKFLKTLTSDIYHDVPFL